MSSRTSTGMTNAFPSGGADQTLDAPSVDPATHLSDSATGASCSEARSTLPAESAPFCFYRHPHGDIWVGDAIAWLRTLDNESVDVVIADPPYNLKKAAWDSFESHAAYIEWSLTWILEAARVLKPTGSVFLCGRTEVLADLYRPARACFAGCRWLIWYYHNKANLGSDWGRSHESILHFRKSTRTRIHLDDIRIPYAPHTLRYPDHPQAPSSHYGQRARTAIWRPHPRGAKPRDVIDVPTLCNGMREKTPHPTQKPEALIRKLILATSRAGDLVIDPFLGSGTTAVAAEQLQRRWRGCDQSLQYCQWARERIESVTARPIEDWIREDFDQAQRRLAKRSAAPRSDRSEE